MDPNGERYSDGLVFDDVWIVWISNGFPQADHYHLQYVLPLMFGFPAPAPGTIFFGVSIKCVEDRTKDFTHGPPYSEAFARQGHGKNGCGLRDQKTDHPWLNETMA